MVEYRKYLKTLILSITLAFLMLYITFGLMFFSEKGNPIPEPFILLLLAVFFIIFTVFYESKEKEKKEKRKEGGGYKPLLKGLFLAICTTFAFVAIWSGVNFMQEGGIQEIVGIEVFISTLAICMIVSMVFLSLLKPLSHGH